MSRIIDDFGYRIKIPDEDFKALVLVDNGIDPYKKIKNKSLQNKVIQEYKRRLVINIASFIKKSTKNKRFIMRQLKSKKKTAKKNNNNQIIKQISKMSWKKLDKINKSFLHHVRTKRKFIPKPNKTRKK